MKIVQEIVPAILIVFLILMFFIERRRMQRHQEEIARILKSSLEADELEDEDEDSGCTSSRTINLLSPGLNALGIRIVQDFYSDNLVLYKKDDVFIGSLSRQELQDPRGSFEKIRKMIEQYEENRKSGESMETSNE